MKKIYFCTILLSIFIPVAYAQDATFYRPLGTPYGGTSFVATNYPSVSAMPEWYQNLQKYWYYRYRLVNDFMIIGTNAGKSLPASRRDRGDSAGTNPATGYKGGEAGGERVA